MKGLEKLTSVRLAEILSQRGTVSTEAITDALYAQDKHGEPFAQVLVGGGQITEWDLAKAVTEHFQLPFLMPSNYSVTDQVRDRLPREVLFKNLLVPIDAFNDVVIVVMPILTHHEVLLRLQKEHDCAIFPYVGLISENKKVLGTLFDDFNAWFEKDQKRREHEATKKANTDRSNWMSIFDAGEQAIQDMIASRPKK